MRPALTQIRVVSGKNTPGSLYVDDLRTSRCRHRNKDATGTEICQTCAAQRTEPLPSPQAVAIVPVGAQLRRCIAIRRDKNQSDAWDTENRLGRVNPVDAPGEPYIEQDHIGTQAPCCLDGLFAGPDNADNFAERVGDDGLEVGRNDGLVFRDKDPDSSAITPENRTYSAPSPNGPWSPSSPQGRARGNTV